MSVPCARFLRYGILSSLFIWLSDFVSLARSWRQLLAVHYLLEGSQGPLL